MKRNPRKYTLADVLWERDIWRHYYDGLEAIFDGRLIEAESCFREAIRLNPDFPGGYEGLVYVEAHRKKVRAQRKFAALAFDKALRLYSHWPRRLPWGIMENRPILRIILIKAMFHHKDGERPEADKWYRLLLKLNPSDNQGIRYLLSGLQEGLPLDEIIRN